MKFADTLRGLLRRWYIVFPGILLAASIALGAWYAIPPGYNRSATQLLIPGENSIPEGANPYLYLGGLSPAADVLVRAVGSENVLNELVEEHPGVEIEITRDTTTAGPIFLISVTAGSDADAEDVLEQLTERTAMVLEEFQVEEDIPAKNRMTVIPITVDTQSVLQQRSRLLATTGAGIAGVILTLLVAGFVDGFSQQRRRRKALSSSDGSDNDEVDTVRNDTDGEDTDRVTTDTEPGPLDPVGMTDPASPAEDPPAPLDQPPDDLSDDEQAPAAPPRRRRRKKR